MASTEHAELGSLTVRHHTGGRHHRTVLRGGALFPALFVAPVAAHWSPDTVMLWRRASFCPRAICVVRILMRRSSWGLGGLA